jgi:hypothetical protein
VCYGRHAVVCNPHALAAAQFITVARRRPTFEFTGAARLYRAVVGAMMGYACRRSFCQLVQGFHEAIHVMAAYVKVRSKSESVPALANIDILFLQVGYQISYVCTR